MVGITVPEVRTRRFWSLEDDVITQRKICKLTHGEGKGITRGTVFARPKRQCQNVPQKAIPYIGTEILFGSSVSHKPIKNWEIENVKVGFLKLSSPTIRLHYQNVIWSHFQNSKLFFLVLQVVFFFKTGWPTKPWNLCFNSFSLNPKRQYLTLGRKFFLDRP